jgi:hypothetical protein
MFAVLFNEIQIGLMDREDGIGGTAVVVVGGVVFAVALVVSGVVSVSLLSLLLSSNVCISR